MKNDPRTLLRFTVPERVNHWLVALTFFLLALSGLVYFQPLYYPLSQLFGGGTWSRILHPFFGVVMIFLFGGMFLRFRKLSIIWRSMSCCPGSAPMCSAASRASICS